MPADEKTPPQTTQDNTTENNHAEARDKEIPAHVAQNAKAPDKDLPQTKPTEHGGQQGLDPTRYGDWEKKGRCTDF